MPRVRGSVNVIIRLNLMWGLKWTLSLHIYDTAANLLILTSSIIWLNLLCSINQNNGEPPVYFELSLLFFYLLFVAFSQNPIHTSHLKFGAFFCSSQLFSTWSPRSCSVTNPSTALIFSSHFSSHRTMLSVRMPSHPL